MKKLKKLSDFKCNELNNIHMSLFKGSMDKCTGGGFSTVWLEDGNGSYCSEYTVTWDSDVDYEVRPGVWSTRYHNEQYISGSCW